MGLSGDLDCGLQQVGPGGLLEALAVKKLRA